MYRVLLKYIYISKYTTAANYRLLYILIIKCMYSIHQRQPRGPDITDRPVLYYMYINVTRLHYDIPSTGE